VDMVNANGQRIPGYPQKWYLAGGASGTVNVGAGNAVVFGDGAVSAGDCEQSAVEQHAEREWARLV